jgi:cytochrome c-type biogenesis protein CcmH/NrfG
MSMRSASRKSTSAGSVTGIVVILLLLCGGSAYFLYEQYSEQRQQEQRAAALQAQQRALMNTHTATATQGTLQLPRNSTWQAPDSTQLPATGTQVHQ